MTVTGLNQYAHMVITWLNVFFWWEQHNISFVGSMGEPLLSGQAARKSSFLAKLN